MHPPGLQNSAVSTPENSGSDGGLYSEIPKEYYKNKLQMMIHEGHNLDIFDYQLSN
jgi:hypothetical protein